jgi:cell division protein FtsZ
MLFVVGGLGGGTGSGAIIPILEQAKKSGILTIAVVTKPFSFEGARRKKVAEQALKFILERADSTIVISNDKLIDMVDKKKTLKESFKTVDRYLASNLKAIISAINEPGVINIDFADVKTTLKDSGMAVLGTGVATGKDRVAKAMENAVNSRVLERDISSARRLLLYITGPDDLGLLEVNKAAEFMRETISPDSAIIFGVKTDEKCDEVSVTFVASDFDG